MTKHTRPTLTTVFLAASAVALVSASGCRNGTEATEAAGTTDKAAAARLDGLSRSDFNRIAAELALPLFWAADANDNDAIDAPEIALLWGLPDTQTQPWITEGTLTTTFVRTYQEMVKIKADGHAMDGLDEAEKKRRALVLKELSQGRPTLILNDFKGANAEDKAIVENILEAAEIVEDIFAMQNGTYEMLKKTEDLDPASRMVLARNQGPWCVAPATENAEGCSALPHMPKKISGLYPASLQENAGFCEQLAQHAEADKLLHQFHVVQADGKKLEAVPYTEAYKKEMTAVSQKLKAAAAAITDDKEAAFKAYLEAAAQAFLDNKWEAADEAWARMNVHNSKWYLRIGPDEVYFEPCSRKAGFHVSFARINQDSIEWQQKLDPVKAEMEEAIARAAGKPYRARQVSFHLPDFIDIILNAGDSRSPHGATIGQSLPNWGPVANEGRGRTVAMTNLYTDPDSKTQLAQQAESLFCKSTMATFTAEPEPQIMSTVLHEAAHNLGPAHEYKVEGKTASQIFGGPLASTMEELKAQTAALYFTNWLKDKKLIPNDLAHQAHTRDIVWSFGHISRGMYTSTGKPKPYSQLAAIQVGFLRKHGALQWRADEMAANGQDKGCIALHLDKFPETVNRLMNTVARIKAKGNRPGALALRKNFVDDEGAGKALREVIAERWLRAPKASFVYSVRM